MAGFFHNIERFIAFFHRPPCRWQRDDWGMGIIFTYAPPFMNELFTNLFYCRLLGNGWMVYSFALLITISSFGSSYRSDGYILPIFYIYVQIFSYSWSILLNGALANNKKTTEQTHITKNNSNEQTYIAIWYIQTSQTDAFLVQSLTTIWAKRHQLFKCPIKINSNK